MRQIVCQHDTRHCLLLSLVELHLKILKKKNSKKKEVMKGRRESAKCEEG